MNILGVDPGQGGGLAIVNRTHRKIVSGTRMPTFEHRGKKLVSPNGIMAWVGNIKIDAIIIERVHAMPKQGVSSSFTFGRSTGAVEAICGMILQGQLNWVSPQVWKKHYGLSSNKQASLDAAATAFGESFTWTKKADDGIAEASLMALWFIDKQLGS